MILQAYIPKSPLDQFVDQFFYHEGYNAPHQVDRFLPDGNVEIIIDLTDEPKYIYDNETLKEIQACHHVWASGLRTEPISIPAGMDSRMVVIYFKKGFAAPFFPVPMDEISDSVVDADLLWGSAFEHLRETLLEAKGIGQIFQLTEDFLLREFMAGLAVNPCIEYAVNAIISRPDRTSLGRLTEKIGYSQKHLIAMFKRQVGVTPKRYVKILRFQKAVAEIEKFGKMDWAAVSQDCGFYDQAHFINDFKSFSGLTPEAYFRAKGEFLNYVPIS